MALYFAFNFCAITSTVVGRQISILSLTRGSEEPVLLTRFK